MVKVTSVGSLVQPKVYTIYYEHAEDSSNTVPSEELSGIYIHVHMYGVV